MTTAIGIHGIRSDGSTNTDLLLEHLQAYGFDTVEGDYPRVNALQAFFKLRSGMRELEYGTAEHVMQKAYSPMTDVVAHSFGCLVSLRMMELGAHFRNVFWFAPAMNRDFVVPNWGCQKMWVIHNPHDLANRMGAMLHRHDFGKMGIEGSAFEGLDYRIKNIAVTDHGTDWLTHSYAFDTFASREHWAQFIYEQGRSTQNG